MLSPASPRPPIRLARRTPPSRVLAALRQRPADSATRHLVKGASGADRECPAGLQRIVGGIGAVCLSRHGGLTSLDARRRFVGPLFGGSLETTANLASLARELQEVEAEAFEVRPLVPAMLELYLDLHCHPESSGQEERTAARVDAALDR